MKKTRVGFTIVELMVVIVVIAILVTMTIVAYTALQDRAADAKRRQDVAQTFKPYHQLKPTPTKHALRQ